MKTSNSPRLKLNFLFPDKRPSPPQTCCSILSHLAQCRPIHVVSQVWTLGHFLLPTLQLLIPNPVVCEPGSLSCPFSALSFLPQWLKLCSGLNHCCHQAVFPVAGPLVPCRLPPCECPLLPWPLGVSALSLCSSGYSSPHSSAGLLRLWFMQHSRCSSPSVTASLTFPRRGALFLTRLPRTACDDQRDSVMGLFTFYFSDVSSPRSFPVCRTGAQ